MEALRQMLEVAHTADFSVGYFHLRGWRKIGDLIDRFEGRSDAQARVLVGMVKDPQQELKDHLRLIPLGEADRGEIKRLETKMVESFREQLIFGMPDNATIAGLRQLGRQLRERKVVVKLFLRHPLHAKLYLTYSKQPGAPTVAFVGSSNLTGPGLSEQGELNVDVTDGDAANKLSRWFNARWKDQFAIDVSDKLAEIIENSWARETLISPYLVYLKIAYHLAFDAIEAPREYKLPYEFEDIVLDFQRDAILRVRHSLRNDPAFPDRNKIALIGDVVGMGKTLTAAAVAKLYQNDEGGNCIVCCPVKLREMWQGYLSEYHIAGEVIPYSQTQRLKDQRGRCRLIILDESHNLRNRETVAWSHIKDFIVDQDAKALLLSATPYNKHYGDLCAQLRLVIDEKADLGTRPENYFRTKTEQNFLSEFQAHTPRCLLAYEKSSSPDDWRDLLGKFMVRRTRGYIIQNHASYDAEKDRYYLTLSNGVKSYFPKRVPLTLKFPLDEENENDQYAKLFNKTVVDKIDALTLPRYGLGRYIDEGNLGEASSSEIALLDNLGKAGKRLIGYCKKNLYKRLESSGSAFILSLERHALRNLVFLYAIDNGLDLPIGTQDSAILDTATSDADADSDQQSEAAEATSEASEMPLEDLPKTVTLSTLQPRAEAIYKSYLKGKKANRRKFKWIKSNFFLSELRDNLMRDALELLEVIQQAGEWKAEKDSKLYALRDLLVGKEKGCKVLVFTQFADTAHYLERELKLLGVANVEAVTSSSPKPAEQVKRFSPVSNRYNLQPDDPPLRILVATEILSEGQNCQDASVVINYDLPWAIIRLIQRAGRVDRIGQDNDEIRIYSCLPADGVEKIIDLRSRLVSRLNQNREVIGTDEQFFEEENTDSDAALRDIYAQKTNLNDPTADANDVDTPSMAKAIWDRAIKLDPSIERQVKALPDQIYATRDEKVNAATGALVYFKTADGYDSLIRVNREKEIVTQSTISVLNDAACPPDIEAAPTHPEHHEIVKEGVRKAIHQAFTAEGALGKPGTVRRVMYDRMIAYRRVLQAQTTNLFAEETMRQLALAIDDLHRYSLKDSARDFFSRRLREGVSDTELAQRVIDKREEGLLSQIVAAEVDRDPKLICSIGLFPK